MDILVPLRLPQAVRLPRAVCALRASGLARALSAFSPVVAGTLPLGIDVPGSDLDILCRLGPPDLLSATLKAFRRGAGVRISRSVRLGRRTLVCRLRLGRLPVEIFAQAGDVRTQRGYSHLALEHRLLRLGGDPVRRAVLSQREGGIKTEPAFARLLGLRGDPYEAMEDLSFATDVALLRLLAARIQRL